MFTVDGYYILTMSCCLLLEHTHIFILCLYQALEYIHFSLILASRILISDIHLNKEPQLLISTVLFLL